MVGLVCAVTLGVVPESYVDLALGEHSDIEVPLAPAGHLVLAECSFRDGLYSALSKKQVFNCLAFLEVIEN